LTNNCLPDAGEEYTLHHALKFLRLHNKSLSPTARRSKFRLPAAALAIARNYKATTGTELVVLFNEIADWYIDHAEFILNKSRPGGQMLGAQLLIHRFDRYSWRCLQVIAEACNASACAVLRHAFYLWMEALNNGEVEEPATGPADGG
jgi:hypothetical protein